MVSKNCEEKIEKSLDEFSDQRNLIGDEIIKIRDSAKRLLDDMFSSLLERLLAEADATDANIAECIKDIKKHITAIKEIETYLSRARSVFDTSGESGYVRAF